MAEQPVNTPEGIQREALEKFTRFSESWKAEDEIIDIMNSLTEISAQTHRSIPEAVFYHGFLPMFANLEGVPQQFKLKDWINVAGGWFNEVDVIDSRGHVLFTVPAMSDRDALAPNAVSNGPSVAHVLITYEQLKLVSPRDAQAYLDNHLGNYVKYVGVDKAVEKIRKTIDFWNTVFERYSLPKWSLTAETALDSQGKPQTIAPSEAVEKPSGFDDF